MRVNLNRCVLLSYERKCRSINYLIILSIIFLSRGMALSSIAKSIKAYDLVVIGGGSAGLTAAKFAATFDKSAVIIEKGKLGGDCTWTGCVPSKTLISCAAAAHAVRTSEKYGIKSGSLNVSWPLIREKIRSTIHKIYEEDDSPEVMKKLGVDTICGRAEFVSEKVLHVFHDNSDDYSEVHVNEGVVISTGASPIIPSSIDGLDLVEYVTYENIFELKELPKTMTCVGGGPISAELSQAFSRLGVKVTIVGPSLLGREDPQVNSVMQKVFEDEGIRIVNGRVSAVRAISISGTKGHSVLVDSDSGNETENIEGELLVIATGRQPVVKGLGLEKIGVNLNPKGAIEVDNTLRTSVKGIYAAGDCTGDKQFTHYAGYQGAVAARNVLLPFTDPGVMKDDVPATTFTAPEVASVGMNEAEARESFGDKNVGVATQEVKEIDRAVCEDRIPGFIKIIYLKKNYKILGATIVSPNAGELISEIGVAMKAGMKFDTLATVMHSYPSYAFALQVMAADIYYEKLSKLKGLLSFLKNLGF